MFGTIRNSLIGAMVAALGATGVSFAATGSLNPVNLVTTTDAGGQDGPSGPGGPKSAANDEKDPKESPGHERSKVGCPQGFTGTHGQFVSQSPKDKRKEAAKSDCGKPVKAKQEHGEKGESGDHGNHEHEDNGGS